ncbi:MAG: alpha/beta hydrolase [Acidobacteriota bacterium]
MFHSVRGSGPPIVLLHGIPTSGRLWHYVVDDLEHRYTCIAVDLPGFGETTLPPEGSLCLDDVAQQVEGLREELGFPSWHVVGHDAGSALAVHYAVAYPRRVERMALVAPPVFPEFRRIWPFHLLQVKGLGEMLAPLVVFIMWSGVLQRGIDSSRPAMREIFDAFRRPFRGVAGSRRLLRILRWGDPEEILGRTAALLPGVEAPCLVIHGRHDEVVPSSFGERAVEVLPDARLVWLDHGHYLPLSLPEEVAAHVGPFLAAA